MTLSLIELLIAAKNWRPLTLLNSLYKLVSGCIAERIKPNLDSIINGDQKGFVAGRYIGEAIRSTYDIMQWAKNNNKTGVLLLIDFEKAYDSLSFSFIKKCLHFFNFGECMIKWVDILLHNFSAIVVICQKSLVLDVAHVRGIQSLVTFLLFASKYYP